MSHFWCNSSLTLFIHNLALSREEERLKKEGLQTQTMHVVSQGHNANRLKKNKRKNRKAPNKEASTNKGFGGQYHFCKKTYAERLCKTQEMVSKER